MTVNVNPADFLSLAVQIGGQEQNKLIADRQATNSENYNKIIKQQTDWQTGELARQAKVASIGIDKERAKGLKAQNDAWLSLTPAQREAKTMLDVTKANNDIQMDIAQQQIRQQQQESQLLRTQINVNNSIEQKVNDIANPIARAVPTASGALLRNQVAEVYRAMLTANDPNVRQTLFDEYKTLSKESIKLSEEHRKNLIADKKELDVPAGYGKLVFESLSPDVRMRVDIAEQSGEKVELRKVGGLFPDVRGGFQHTWRKPEWMDVTTANERGFSAAQWNKSKSSSVAELAKQGYESKIKSKKSTVSDKGDEMISVKEVGGEKREGQILLSEYNSDPTKYIRIK